MERLYQGTRIAMFQPNATAQSWVVKKRLHITFICMQNCSRSSDTRWFLSPRQARCTGLVWHPAEPRRHFSEFNTMAAPCRHVPNTVANNVSLV